MGTYDTHSGHPRHDPALDEDADDSLCAFCGADLPEANPDDQDHPTFNGFCDHGCWAKHLVQSLAKFPDDDVNGATRRELNRCIDELIKSAAHLSIFWDRNCEV